jgi:cytochrome P450
VEVKLTARQAVVGINPWVAHRNTEVFGRDAEDFVPERWDQEQTSQERLVAMEQYNLAFGAGSRTCVGRHISHLGLVKLIPELVKRYDFEFLGEDLTHCNRWFVKPDGLPCRIRRR